MCRRGADQRRSQWGRLPMHVLPDASTVMPLGHWQMNEPSVLTHLPLTQTSGNSSHSFTSISRGKRTQKQSATTASKQCKTSQRSKTSIKYSKLINLFGENKSQCDGIRVFFCLLLYSSCRSDIIYSIYLNIFLPSGLTFTN